MRAQNNLEMKVTLYRPTQRMGASESTQKQACMINTRSPIDLPDTEPECSATTYPAFVTFRYTDCTFAVQRPPDIAHTTLTADADTGCHVLYSRDKYTLRRVTIQVPSAHSFGQARYPMELQLHHQDEAGGHLIASFMVKVADCDSGHYDRKELLTQLLRDAHSSGSVEANLQRMINKTHTGFYFYEGSYENHGCHKATRIVFSRPIGIPREVIEEYIESLFHGGHPPPKPAAQHQRMEHTRVRYNPQLVQEEEEEEEEDDDQGEAGPAGRFPVDRPAPQPIEQILRTLDQHIAEVAGDLRSDVPDAVEEEDRSRCLFREALDDSVYDEDPDDTMDVDGVAIPGHRTEVIIHHSPPRAAAAERPPHAPEEEEQMFEQIADEAAAETSGALAGDDGSSHESAPHWRNLTTGGPDEPSDDEDDDSWHGDSPGAVGGAEVTSDVSHIRTRSRARERERERERDEDEDEQEDEVRFMRRLEDNMAPSA